MSDLMNINVKIEGLDEEIKDEIAQIKKQIPKALEQVGSEMIESLSRHLDEDFYNKYSPVAYRRRYTEGLKNKKNMVYYFKSCHILWTKNQNLMPKAKLKFMAYGISVLILIELNSHTKCRVCRKQG